jgi:hypothetical protein
MLRIAAITSLSTSDSSLETLTFTVAPQGRRSLTLRRGGNRRLHHFGKFTPIALPPESAAIVGTPRNCSCATSSNRHEQLASAEDYERGWEDKCDSSNVADTTRQPNRSMLPAGPTDPRLKQLALGAAWGMPNIGGN